MFSGAALWLLFSRLAAKEDTEKVEDQQEVIPEKEVIVPKSLTVTQLLTEKWLPSAPRAGKMVKCNCGLEFHEDAMQEHVVSTGHSKPFDLTNVRVGKIWDLEEAVIESASPECTKCGKPVSGLKRIGKTIYVAHLGCMDNKQESKPARTTRARPQIGSCPICWRPVYREAGTTKINSPSGSQLLFHEECLELQSATPITTAQNSGNKGRD